MNGTHALLQRQLELWLQGIDTCGPNPADQRAMAERILDVLKQWAGTQMDIVICCKSGRHLSVALASLLEALQVSGELEVHHLDQDKWMRSSIKSRNEFHKSQWLADMTLLAIPVGQILLLCLRVLQLPLSTASCSLQI